MATNAHIMGALTRAPSMPDPSRLGTVSDPLGIPGITAARVVETCNRLGIAPSTFGRDAVGDPRLVFDLRAGRTLRKATAQRIAAHLAKLGGC